MFNTLLNAAGLAVQPNDGLDLTSLLEKPASKLNRDALFFHYPHYYATTTPVSAVRAGDWKLLEFFEDNHIELYDLHDDLGLGTRDEHPSVHEQVEVPEAPLPQHVLQRFAIEDHADLRLPAALHGKPVDGSGADTVRAEARPGFGRGDGIVLLCLI